MVETRRAPRFKVSKPARIGGEQNAARCIIRDLSITGAALEVESQADAPDKFTLTVPEDDLALSARVVWRRRYRIGIAFEYTPEDIHATGPSNSEASLAEELRANGRKSFHESH
jgi:hypothetical protein